MAQRGERKLEARGTTKTGQEDASSKCRHTWHKILERAALPQLLRSTHSKDVRLDVQLNIIGLFSGDSFAKKRPSFLIAVDHLSAFTLVLFTMAVLFISDFGVLKTLEIGGVNSLCHASCVHLDDGITIPCFGLCLDWHPSRNSGMDTSCSDTRGRPLCQCDSGQSKIFRVRPMADLGQFELGQFDFGHFDKGQFDSGQVLVAQTILNDQANFDLGQFDWHTLKP